MDQLVSYKIENGVATITMDDGKANALSSAIWEQLGVAFDEAEEAGAMVVLTGRPGIFSGSTGLYRIRCVRSRCNYLRTTDRALTVRLRCRPHHQT